MKLKMERQRRIRVNCKITIWRITNHLKFARKKISINSDELWELRIESSSFSKRKEEFQAGDVLGPNWKKNWYRENLLIQNIIQN